LSFGGIRAFLAEPVRPELLLGVAVTAALFLLNKRVPSAALIPLVMLAATVIAQIMLSNGLCAARCDADIWRFSNDHAVQWMPPWQIQLDTADVQHIVASLPGMLVVSFVAVLTVLLSVSTLEITFQREFELNKMLRAHALLAGLSAALGGYIALITIGRTVLSSQTGGKVLAGVIAAGVCIAVLLGAGTVIFHIPKAALGGLVLYLGVSFLKHWLWDKRKSTSALEYVQIFLILGIVANYGYMTGFAAGLLLSCVLFVVTYSRVPLANLATNLTVFSSSVVRPEYEVDILRAHGGGTHVYRLGGYVFFGSASKIEAVFKDMGPRVEGVVIDFTNVSGIDGSAIGVFRRILRRYWGSGIRFNFVTTPGTENAIRHFSPDDGGSLNVQHFSSLDHALESAEEAVLARWNTGAGHSSCFEFLEDADERLVFEQHCERREIKQGERLSSEGDFADEVFFIAAGSFDVVKKTMRLAKLRPGAIVGEIAFYTGASRTASIIAARDAAVFAFHKDMLTRLRASHPDLATKFDLMVIRKVSGALARTSTLVTMFK
jgi:SulP family sulfate permease